MENLDICVIPFKGEKLHKAKGYDGLISPEGEFFKVCKRDKLVAAHDYFAEMYMYYKHDIDINHSYRKFQALKPHYQHINLAPKDILINIYGYVNYEHIKNGHVEITPPQKEYNNLELTDQQLLTIVELIELNSDNEESLTSLFAKYYDEPKVFRKKWLAK
jgi:hypothetical protein